MHLNTRLAALAMAAAITIPALGAFASGEYLDRGSLIDGHLTREINSKTAEDGDRFAIRTDAGSTIYGHLTQVARANIGRKAHLTLNFDRIRFPDGASEPIDAKVVSVNTQRKVNYVRAAGTVLGGMIAGNILGKALGTNAGGALGVVGGGLLAANTASDIDIPEGSPIELQLTQPLTIRSQAR